MQTQFISIKPELKINIFCLDKPTKKRQEKLRIPDATIKCIRYSAVIVFKEYKKKIYTYIYNEGVTGMFIYVELL